MYLLIGIRGQVLIRWKILDESFPVSLRAVLLGKRFFFIFFTQLKCRCYG